MSQVAFSPSIASRPTYAALVSRGGVPALMIAEGPGAAALVELGARDPSAFGAAEVILIPDPSRAGEDRAALAALGPRHLHEAPDLPALLARLRSLLPDLRMGTQIYLAGSEAMIGAVTAALLGAGVTDGAIQAEHRGSIARRMQCVHCKGITEGVTASPFTCSQCGLTLFVRDHYSRRLGAFQGVCVDAETPGIVPEREEIRP